MATYIQGLNDYIPQIQPFQLDYNFLSNILQTKQSRYDTAHKELNGIYGTLLNSPMTRDDNVTKRDNFFKMISQDIQKVSGMDLSLEQNVDQASNIFKPFYEDKSMIKDMVWTKSLYNEMDRAENFKTCVDPDKCGGQFWEGGVEALQWKAQEFKNAAPDEALNFSAPEFTPYVNVVDKAIKSAKDAGFGIKYDEIKGGYIVTTKNGDRMVAPLASFFTSKFGSEPTVQAYFKTQAYLQRKNWVAQNASAHGGEDQATIAYMNQMMGTTQSAIASKKSDADHQDQILQTRKNNYDKAIRKNGVLLTNTDEISAYQNLSSTAEVTSANKEYYKNASDLSNNVSQNSKNTKAIADKFDELVGLNLLSGEMVHAASAYANLTQETSMTADPFAIQAQGHKNAMDQLHEEKGYIDANGNFVPGLDYYNKTAEKAYDAEQQKKADEAFLGKDIPKYFPEMKGTGTTEVTTSAAENAAKLNELYKGATGDKLKYVQNMIGAIEQYSKTPGEYSNAEDNVTQVYIAAGFKPLKAQQYARDVLKGGQTKVDALNVLGAIDESKLSSVYSTSINLSDPSAKMWGTLNQDWNKTFWDANSTERVAAENKEFMYKSMSEWNKKQMDEIVAPQVVGFYNNAKDPNSASFATQLMNNTSNGIIPQSATWKQKQIDTWVATNSGKFKDTPQHTEFAVSGGTGGAAGSTWTVPGKTKEEYAREFATKAFDNVTSTIQNIYLNGDGNSKGAQAWNHDSTLGPTSSGKAAMGIGGTGDPAAVYRNGTLNNAELLRNYQGAKTNAVVSFGDGSKQPEQSDPAAVALLDQYSMDFLKNPGKRDPNRAMGDWTFQRIASNDPNTWAFTVYPSQSYLKQFAGTKDAPGIAAPYVVGTGITVFLPKDKADNSLYSATAYDDFDFQLDKRGNLPITGYPDTGQVQLQKINGMYSVSGYLNYMNEDGTISKAPIVKSDGSPVTYSSDLEASTVFYDWQNRLAQYQQELHNQKAHLSQQQGVKNPQELINAPIAQ